MKQPVIAGIRFLRRLDPWLFVVSLILGLYLAAGNILRAAKWPKDEVWLPWEPLFIGLLAGAIWVPIYAFIKAADARLEKQERLRVEADESLASVKRDLDLLCRQTLVAITDRCDKALASDIAASIWLCNADRTFEVVAEFYLPYKRPVTGVIWTKGKGVAGMAWESNEDLRIDLVPLQEKQAELGDATFDRLPTDERLGMTALEVRQSNDYKGVCALRIIDRQSAAPDLLGFLVIDYAGDDEFNCVSEASEKRPVSTYLGSATAIMSDNHEILRSGKR